VSIIRRHDPLLPIAIAFLLSRPAWIKRRLAANGHSVLKAQAKAEAK
jgi:hypothetical protein